MMWIVASTCTFNSAVGGELDCGLMSVVLLQEDFNTTAPGSVPFGWTVGELDNNNSTWMVKDPAFNPYPCLGLAYATNVFCTDYFYPVPPSRHDYAYTPWVQNPYGDTAVARPPDSICVLFEFDYAVSHGDLIVDLEYQDAFQNTQTVNLVFLNHTGMNPWHISGSYQGSISLLNINPITNLRLKFTYVSGRDTAYEVAGALVDNVILAVDTTCREDTIYPPPDTVGCCDLHVETHRVYDIHVYPPWQAPPQATADVLLWVCNFDPDCDTSSLIFPVLEVNGGWGYEMVSFYPPPFGTCMPLVFNDVELLYGENTFRFFSDMCCDTTPYTFREYIKGWIAKIMIWYNPKTGQWEVDTVWIYDKWPHYLVDHNVWFWPGQRVDSAGFGVAVDTSDIPEELRDNRIVGVWFRRSVDSSRIDTGMVAIYPDTIYPDTGEAPDIGIPIAKGEFALAAEQEVIGVGFDTTFRRSPLTPRSLGKFHVFVKFRNLNKSSNPLSLATVECKRSACWVLDPAEGLKRIEDYGPSRHPMVGLILEDQTTGALEYVPLTPAASELYVRYENGKLVFSRALEGGVLRVYESSGRLVKALSVQKGAKAVEVGKLSRGVYFYRYGTRTGKFLVR